MKSFKYKIPVIMLLMLMSSMSCKKVTITTVLNADASFQRTISVSGDSSGVDDTVYPFPTDGSWNFISNKDSANNYTYIISKDFSNVNELNKELAYRDDTVKVNALARLDKKFRWFYSYFRYEETFFKFFPFRGANLLDFVTEDELKTYYAGNDSTEIEDRIEKYAEHAFFEDFYAVLLGAVEKYNFNITREMLNAQKQKLFEACMDWEFFGDNEDFADFFLKACDKVYSNPASFLSLKPEFNNINQTYIEYYKFVSDIIGEDYRMVVDVPGRVVDTNANKDVKDNEVAWEFEPESFHYQDFTMWVESRRFNIVPTVITGLFVAVGLMLLWLSARRTYRQKLAAKGIEWENRKRFVLPWWLSVILILGGIVLAGYFIWVYFIFNAHPVFLLLDFFNVTPRDNVIFISLSVIGIVLALFGGFQLVLFFKMRKRRNDKLDIQNS